MASFAHTLAFPHRMGLDWASSTNETGGPAEPSRLAKVAFAVLALVCLAGIGWKLSGGSWAVISTPSMGTADPVGTLVLLRPAALADLTIGDVVSYRPANNRGHIYTHRVVATFLDGSLQVQGDINGAADPLPVAQPDLVGKVVAHCPGLGYLIRALPVLLLGEIVLLLATGFYVPARWRSSLRILGCCLLIGATSLITRPFVHPVLIATTDDGGGAVASVVSTGILPTRVTGVPGHSIVLHAGQTGTVPVAATRAGGPVAISGSPDLHGWWLAAMIMISLLPLIWCLTVGLAPHAADKPDDEPDTQPDSTGFASTVFHSTVFDSTVFDSESDRGLESDVDQTAAVGWR